MASEKTLTIRLRADFIAWLEQQAAQKNDILDREGKDFRVTASDVAAPILQEAIQQLRTNGDAEALYQKNKM